MYHINRSVSLIVAACILVAVGAHSLGTDRSPHGPFNPEKWPPTLDLTRKVHFVSIDGALTSANSGLDAELEGIDRSRPHYRGCYAIGGHT